MPYNILLAPHTVSHIADNNTWTLRISLKLAYSELYLDIRINIGQLRLSLGNRYTLTSKEYSYESCGHQTSLHGELLLPYH